MKANSKLLSNLVQNFKQCRHCKGDLVSRIQQLEWTNKLVLNQRFFFSVCPLCQQSIYFWEDLSQQKFYFQNKLHIVLVAPEIPGNVGTIIRLACAFDLTLHLIEPFGFIYSEKWLRRSSANHFHLADTYIYSTWEDFAEKNRSGTFFLTSAKASRNLSDYDFLQINAPIYLIFGCESTGLPTDLKRRFKEFLFVIPQTSRTSSINLGHAVAISSAFVRYQYFHFNFSSS